ncbi:MAG: capsule biosynthesis protein, partial [Mangrovicoccus sp.]
LPVLLVMYYMFEVATPLYAVKSEFMVQNSAPGSAGGALGGVAAVQEAVASQRYLESLDAMVRLNQEEGFIAHFSGENIDPLTRLPADATNEQAFKLYQKKVRLGYDPTEGVVRLEVIAADPETAMRFSKALIGYAEEVTNNLTLRQREDRKRDAETAYSTAYDQLGAAQARVTELQQERGILSAEAEVGAIMSQISTFELELRQEELSLASLQDNPRPNTTLVTVAERRIARLEATIADLRAQLTQGSENSTSLARIKGELLIAEADLTGRQQLFQQALENLTTARQELLQQTGYLTLNVSPILPQEAAYPRRWPNTAMAFLIFAGIYLIASLTASILKEQVSG